MFTNREFDFVKSKVKEEDLRVHKTNNVNDDKYVELRGNAHKVDGTGVELYKIYMKNKEEYDKVVEKLK